MEIYRSPDVSWQYNYLVVINGYEYQFGDRMPMETAEDAQAALTYAVESHDHIPVNILGSLRGGFDTPNRFMGTIRYADDLPDGSDLDENTERDVEVMILCTQIRADTVLGK